MSEPSEKPMLFLRSFDTVKVCLAIALFLWVQSCSNSLTTTETPPYYPGTITTIAGTGFGTWDNADFRGDNGPASRADLFDPCGLAFDPNGNIYIADTRNARIRKVDIKGIITTIAGNGTYGNSGDDGPAIQAQLNNVHAICLDPVGNLYCTDSDGDRIRKITPSGIISAFAGNGNTGYSGDNGPAVKAQLNWPYGICSDSLGNIYIADGYNNVVRKVDTAGIIMTVAGNGTAGFSGDNDLAIRATIHFASGVSVDTSGNLFIADQFNNRIRKVDTTGTIRTIAGNGTAGFSGDGGPAVEATIDSPISVFADTKGNVFFSDYNNACIRKIDSTGIITTVAGIGGTGWGFAMENGPACRARLSNAHSIFVDSLGSVYIADSANNRIRKVYY